MDGAWLQAVFYFARHNGMLSPDRYARLTADLASLRHQSIAFEASDVERLVALVTPETKYRIHAMASCLGTKNAGMASHIRVLRESIERLWEDGPTLEGKLATGLLIQNAIRHQPRYRSMVLGVANGTLSRYIGGEEYFRNWKIGHCIIDSKPADRLSVTSGKRAKPKRKRDKERRRRDWLRHGGPPRP